MKTASVVENVKSKCAFLRMMIFFSADPFVCAHVLMMTRIALKKDNDDRIFGFIMTMTRFFATYIQHHTY